MSRSTRGVTVALSYSSVVDDSQQPSPLVVKAASGTDTLAPKLLTPPPTGVAVSAGWWSATARMPHCRAHAAHAAIAAAWPREAHAALVHQAQHRVARRRRIAHEFDRLEPFRVVGRPAVGPAAPSVRVGSGGQPAARRVRKSNPVVACGAAARRRSHDKAVRRNVVKEIVVREDVEATAEVSVEVRNQREFLAGSRVGGPEDVQAVTGCVERGHGVDARGGGVRAERPRRRRSDDRHAQQHRRVGRVRCGKATTPGCSRRVPRDSRDVASRRSVADRDLRLRGPPRRRLRLSLHRRARSTRGGRIRRLSVAERRWLARIRSGEAARRQWPPAPARRAVAPGGDAIARGRPRIRVRRDRLGPHGLGSRGKFAPRRRQIRRRRPRLRADVDGDLRGRGQLARCALAARHRKRHRHRRREPRGLRGDAAAPRNRPCAAKLRVAGGGAGRLPRFCVGARRRAARPAAAGARRRAREAAAPSRPSRARRRRRRRVGDVPRRQPRVGHVPGEPPPRPRELHAAGRRGRAPALARRGAPAAGRRAARQGLHADDREHARAQSTGAPRRGRRRLAPRPARRGGRVGGDRGGHVARARAEGAQGDRRGALGRRRRRRPWTWGRRPTTRSRSAAGARARRPATTRRRRSSRSSTRGDRREASGESESRVDHSVIVRIPTCAASGGSAAR